jgi:mRNA interferase MazF
MVKEYIPDRGDVVWVDFSPTVGREQRGHRPALVLSPSFYNHKSSIVVACPMTRSVKGYTFEVVVNFDGEAASILSDQVKSFDWRQRKVTYGGKVEESTVSAVQDKIMELIGVDEN